MQLTNDIPIGLRLDDLGGAEIVCGRFRNHRFPKHSHDGLMLSLISEGTQRIRYRGETYLGRRGVLIAVPPNEVHAGEPEDDRGWRYRTITIPTDLIGALSGAVNTHFLCDTVIRDGVLCEALARVFALFGEAALLEQEEALMAVLSRFLAAHTSEAPPEVPTGTERRVVALCKEYLAARLDRNVGLADLEAAAGIDRFRLVRSFTRHEGLSPHAWHLQCRLRTAQAMLSRGEAIADVTYATGFADQAHLTRAFKRLTGLTPGYYRRTHLALSGK
ncbi:helix-turn-helix domain-containing protein [Roseibium aggregatum]|uniref:AraC family transcriptional regulator n=1 Tax=Roseibium aggregatum TaxID=187304 RepID=A0A926P410_9HYPH|nr:AraC family transcriptional regulator [Roseibium aggregatum]MBD1549348.1 AraC family transcriptional regulator [Roseibium aggregatum]